MYWYDRPPKRRPLLCLFGLHRWLSTGYGLWRCSECDMLRGGT